MTDLPPTIDPRNIWKNQKRENPVMTVHELRVKVKNLKAKARTTMIFNLVTATVITSIFISVFVLYVHGAYGRISWSLVLAGAFYMLGYIVFESLRAMRAEQMEPDTGISNCLRYYRQLLEHKRLRARHMALAAVPLIAGGVMSFLPAVAMIIRYPDGSMWVRLLPFCIILTGWFVLFLLMRRRMRREFQREFGILETLEREYPE